MVVAKNFILRSFPSVVLRFAGLVDRHRHNLFYYMMFLRITPICPNWVVNISSPIVGVPYLYFFTATLVGLMPLNLVHLRTGLLLNDISQFGVDLKVSPRSSRPSPCSSPSGASLSSPPSSLAKPTD